MEPIYQWIPELNKRVYSDKYERFLDKSYEVSEDVDFMLLAYRRLLAAEPTRAELHLEAEAAAAEEAGEAAAAAGRGEFGRRELARRLARLGGGRQLVESLRSALEMQQLDWSRFRALRLVRPTSELSGRFTCSVSSLDGDDLRSTRLVVYGKFHASPSHPSKPLPWRQVNGARDSISRQPAGGTDSQLGRRNN